MTDESPEVRRCAKCEQPAVVLVNDWKHSINGLKTSESTRDYRCQECGAWFVRRSRARVLALWIVGVLLSLTPVGIPCLYLAWRHQTFDRRLPVVVGAPMPPMRFPGGPPERTCQKCAAIAMPVRITRHTHNGLPTGTDSQYRCGGCGLEFTITDAWGHIFAGLMIAALAGVALAFHSWGTTPGWKWGGLGGATLGAVGIAIQYGTRLVNRQRNPAAARRLSNERARQGLR